MKKRKKRELKEQQQDKDKKYFKKINIDYYVLFGVLFLSICFFHKALDNECVLLGDDILNYLIYLRAFVSQTIKEGILPLWNPYIFSGVPCLAGMQSAVLYPPNICLTPLPVNLQINISVLLHHWLAGYFLYLFVKTLRCHWLSALTAGIIFMFSGFQITHLYAGHCCMFAASIWLPLILLCIEKLKETLNNLYAIIGGIILCIQFLAGHPQISFYSYIFLGLYIIVIILSTTKKKDILKLLWLLIIMGIIGFCLASIQVFASLEFSKYSTRSTGVDYQFIIFSSFSPENILTFLFPWIFGNALNIPYRGEGLFHEVCGYIGVLPLILILLAWYHHKKVYVIFFTIITCCAILLAFGEYTPVYKFFYKYVPGFDTFRVPSRILYLYTLCMAILTGLGCDVLIKGISKNKIISCLLYVTGILGTVLCILALNISPDVDIWQKIAKFTLQENIVNNKEIALTKYSIIKCSVIFILSFILIYFYSKLQVQKKNRIIYFIPVIILIDLWTFGYPYVRVVGKDKYEWQEHMVEFLKTDNEHYRIATLIDAASLNCGMMYDIANIGGYSPSGIKRYQDIICISQEIPLDTIMVVVGIRKYSKILQLLNTKYYILPRQCPISHPQFRLVFSDNEVNIYQDNNYLKKAWIVHKFRIIQSDKIILETLDELKYKDEVILEEKPSIEIEPVPISTSGDSIPEIIKYSPNEIIIKAGLASNGLLVLSEIYYPGWRAVVDGMPQKIYRANYILRAIPLKQGTHIIRITYEPKWLKYGMILTLGMICIILSYIIIRNYKIKGNDS